MLDQLDGTCHTPIGGLAAFNEDGDLTLKGLVARPDGTALFRAELIGASVDAHALGRELGARLRRDASDKLFF